MTVLIIDKDAEFRAKLAAVLREDGHVVLDHEWPGALPPLGTLDDVSLVITDHTADRDDGMAFAEAFHQAHPRTPIVVLTGYWSFQLASEVAGKGLIHLRRKPISFRDLRLFVNQVAGKAGSGRLRPAG